MSLTELKRLAQEAEANWKRLRDRTTRYLSLEQETAYEYGRMMAFYELISVIEIGCELCRDGLVNHKHTA